MKPIFAVIGGGSWATALVKILTDSKQSVYWWMRDHEAVEHIRQFSRNPRYLNTVEIKLRRDHVSTNLKRIVAKADILIMAVPAAFLRSALQSIKPEELVGKKVVSAIKGMIPGENILIADYFHRFFNIPVEDLAVITGPCHAEEVAMEKLSYLTIGCEKPELAQLVADSLACRYIRTHSSEDIWGTEIASVMKNIFAIASGITHGLGYGDNFQAVLISNAIQEMEVFLKVYHPINRDIKGSAYLGDLLVTAYSQYSRNRTFGNMIGRGYSVKNAQIEMNMIAEGYYAVVCIEALREKFGLSLPITEAVYHILYLNAPPRPEIERLTRKLS